MSLRAMLNWRVWNADMMLDTSGETTCTKRRHSVKGMLGIAGSDGQIATPANTSHAVSTTSSSLLWKCTS